MNPIIQRIAKEGISLEKHYKDGDPYFYHCGKNLITYPAFNDLDHQDSMYSLAHELGHHYQLNRYSYIHHLLSSISRMKHILSILFFPFLLWEEMYAWILAWRICKEENVSREGFLDVAIRALTSYIKAFLTQIIQILKYVLGLYVATIFAVRFLTISEDFDLRQPSWLQSLRHELVSSTASYDHIISSIFTGLLHIWIMLLVFHFVIKIAFEISGGAKA